MIHSARFSPTHVVGFRTTCRLKAMRYGAVLIGVIFGASVSLAADLIGPDGLERAGLARYWQVDIPLASAERLDAVYQANEYLYAVTDHAVVFAIEADSGVIRWAQQVDLPGNKVFAPTHRVDASGSRQVVIATATRIGMYEVRQGDRVSEIPLSFAPSTTVVADAERLYIGGLNRRMNCYRISDQWRAWQVMTGGPVRSTPQLIGEDLYFAAEDGRIYACRAADRMKRWVANTGSSIGGDVSISDSTVFAAAQDRYVYAYDRQTGIERWRRQLPSPFTAGPILAGDTLYQIGDDGGLFVLDPDRGAVRWTNASADAFLARGPSRVYLLDDRGMGLVLDNATGDQVAVFDASPARLHIANTVDETLFLADRYGSLQCIRLRHAPPLRREFRAPIVGSPVAAVQRAPAAAEEIIPAEPELPNSIAEVVRDPFRSRRNVTPLAGRRNSTASSTSQP